MDYNTIAIASNEKENQKRIERVVEELITALKSTMKDNISGIGVCLMMVRKDTNNARYITQVCLSPPQVIQFLDRINQTTISLGASTLDALQKRKREMQG